MKDLSGMRAASVAAISIFLGFSLTFVRFWAFDPTDWVIFDIVPGISILLSLFFLLLALWRGLDPAVTSADEFETIRLHTFIGFTFIALAVILELLRG